MVFRRSVVLLLFPALALIQAGCGGHRPKDPVETPVKFSIEWPTKSRAIHAPSSARSVTVTVSGAGPGGSDVVTTVNRTGDLPGYTKTYTSAVPAKPGAYAVHIRFYTDPDGGGTEVAMADANATIDADGNGIGDVAIDKLIQNVIIEPGQMVATGKTRQLWFSARGPSDEWIAVPEGSDTWEISGSTDAFTLTPDGIATGLAPGSGSVTVTVDGVKGGPSVIEVRQSAQFADPGFEQLGLAAGNYTWAPDGIPWRGDSTWGIADGANMWGSGGHGGSDQYAVLVSSVGEESFEAGSITQTVDGFEVGKNYRITMWISRRNRGDGGTEGNTGASVSMLMNDFNTLMDPTYPDPDGQFHQVSSRTFTAEATILKFTVQTQLPDEWPGSAATLIDDVQIEEVP